MCSNTAVRTPFSVAVRVLINVPLHVADYFYFGITVNEDVIDVIICQVSPYTGCSRNNSHILKGNKNQTKQGTQKILLFIKSTYNAVF